MLENSRFIKVDKGEVLSGEWKFSNWRMMFRDEGSEEELVLIISTTLSYGAILGKLTW